METWVRVPPTPDQELLLDLSQGSPDTRPKELLLWKPESGFPRHPTRALPWTRIRTEEALSNPRRGRAATLSSCEGVRPALKIYLTTHFEGRPTPSHRIAYHDLAARPLLGSLTRASPAGCLPSSSPWLWACSEEALAEQAPTRGELEKRHSAGEDCRSARLAR